MGHWGAREALIPWAHIEIAGVGWRRINRTAHRPSWLRMFYLRVRVPPTDSLSSTHVRWLPGAGEIQLLHPPRGGLGAVMRAIRQVRADCPLEGEAAEPGPIRRALFRVGSAAFDTALIAVSLSSVLLLASHGPGHAGAFVEGLRQERSLDFSALEARFYRHFPLTLREQFARMVPGGELDWLAHYERGQRVWHDETRTETERFARVEESFVSALDRLTPTLAFRHMSLTLLREIFDGADSVMRTQGHWGEIEILRRRKVQLFRAHLGPDRLLTGAAHEALGNVLHRRGDPESARVEFAEAMRISRLRGRRSFVENLQKKLVNSR